MLLLLRNKTFILFFLGNIVSLIGFGFNMIALSWMVLEETGSELALGKIMATATAPGLFLALFAGVIIDKVNRKWLLVVLDAFRLVVIVLFLTFIAFNEFELLILYPVVILMGLGNSLFWPTAQAFVQEIVTESDYFNANKLLSASYQFGSILGAGAGGLIVHYYDPIVALNINIITYLISGILIALAPFRGLIRKSKDEKLFNAISKGLVYLYSRLDILVLGMATILSDVAIWGALSVLTITISKEIFLQGTFGYGIMEGMYGVGALLSTISVGIALDMMGRKSFLIICYLIAGAMCFISPLMPNIYFAGIAYMFMGLHNNAARIIIRTIFMENIPNSIMGRVQTVLGIYTRAMVTLSALYVGWYIESSSINTAVLFTTTHYLTAFLGTILVMYLWKESPIFLSKPNHA